MKRNSAWSTKVGQFDPLQEVGKKLEETTLDDFSEGWDKSNDQNLIAGLLQMRYPQRHEYLLNKAN